MGSNYQQDVKQRVTQLIKQFDSPDSRGAIPMNSTVLNTMHRMLTEAGSGSWAEQFLQNANIGQLKSIQSLLSSGVPGATGGGNLLSAFQSLISSASNAGQNQTNSQVTNTPIPPGADNTMAPQAGDLTSGNDNGT